MIALCDQIALCKLTVTTPPKFDWRCAIDNPSKDDYQKRRFSFWNFDELLSIMLGRIEEIANQPDVRLWDNHPNLARAANDRLPPIATVSTCNEQTSVALLPVILRHGSRSYV